MADSLGNRLWPDWDRAPFAVLLITPEQEFLIRHPRPSDDFTLAGEDTLLKSKVWHRPRKFPTHFLATFPAVGGVPTIVIGQAENTEAKTSSRWVVTLLHEHFHQLQNSQPGYYDGVNALGLARGDSTGMWMLNYPFPYAAPEVKEQFSVMSRALAAALKARERPDFSDKFAAYVVAREKFRALLQPDDSKYFAFQIWQEGIARYTEYRLAEFAAAEFKPSEAFRGLADYKPFEGVARDLVDGIEKELVSVELDKAGRTAVYSFGAAEGLVLDRVRPEWRKGYFVTKFTLDENFKGRMDGR
ncbi:MAG: hypothetical protein ACREOU_09285 [Candidatus Eiseniibacteriota bacterium]